MTKISLSLWDELTTHLRDDEPSGDSYVLGSRRGIICKAIFLQHNGEGCGDRPALDGGIISCGVAELVRAGYIPAGLAYIGTEGNGFVGDHFIVNAQSHDAKHINLTINHNHAVVRRSGKPIQFKLVAKC